MDKRLLYRIAYRELENCTPLRYDCGILCEKACCKGDDETGMYVFPGEEVMTEGTETSLEIMKSGFKSSSGAEIGLALCRGCCQRNHRPLSCRIFPLTPYITPEGRLKVEMDPRAVPICPIAANSNVGDLNPFFVRRVEKVLRLLFQDKEIREFMHWLSELLDEYTLLIKKARG